MKLKTSTKFFISLVTTFFSPFVTWRLFNWYVTSLNNLGHDLGWSDHSIGEGISLMIVILSVLLVMAIGTMTRRE